MADEVTKLKNHLSLLKEEYVKLQERFADVEKKYQVALASSGDGGENNFVSKLLGVVADLFDKEQYSDVRILLEGGHQLNSHRFVLAARSDDWGIAEIGNGTELDLTDIKYEVGHAMMKWVYTDEINLKVEDTFLLELLRAATRFKLESLRVRCENGLMSFVNMKNCIKFYQTAEEMSAEVLKLHCSELITNHWNDFTSDDFVYLPAPLLYKMFKTKTEYPLHTSIRAQREDVVFLFLIEYDSKLQLKLNELDDKGDIALDLALQSKQESISQTLINHKADVNKTDKVGKCLLHKAIKRGDDYAASFLIKNNADVNMSTHLDKETPLHMVATFNPEVVSSVVMTGMAKIAKQLLEHKADANAQDTTGSTPLHTAVVCNNRPVLQVLLETGKPDLEIKNSDGFTVLWLALHEEGNNSNYGDDSFAAMLLKHGSSPNAIEPESGNSLLHLAAKEGNEAAGIFLAKHGAKVDHTNSKGESALHLACQTGLKKLVEIILENGGNSNIQTKAASDLISNMSDMEGTPARQTPLHVALTNKHNDIVQVFLDFKTNLSKKTNNLAVVPNFNIKDSQGQTILGLSLWNGQHEVAARLLMAGANINEKNAEGLTLLHQAIDKQDTIAALFLIENNSDYEAKSPDQLTALQHAIQRHLPVVVDTLCSKGCNMNVIDTEANCPLWQALDSGQEDIAHTLVQYKCDVNFWSPGPSGCQQTLLHRAIDENNESVACFLIRSMCDKNSPRKEGLDGQGGDEAKDGQTPLHLACAWGQEKVVQCLMEHDVNMNVQDAEGKTPVHIAIENQHAVIISLLLAHPMIDLTIRDKTGQTPFSVAMATKNNKAAQAILNREPTAAEQNDNRGRNFLHLAIQKCDIESVLFLIAVHANVNSRVQDSNQLTPLHLAVMAGSEIIVRNLLLAGASVNEPTKSGETALHLAATNDSSGICGVLLENNVDYDAVDENLNNALHTAVYHGHLNSIKILLTESRINAEAVNAKGQTPLHILGQHNRENSAAIFELFRETMPEYPIDIPDDDGNTVLLLAYMNGNGNLCRALVRAGTCMGVVNKQGLSIFNAPVATKQLLFKLLDMLSAEPPWSEGEHCLECNVKFGIKTRKHHCRHCGRLLCSKCSAKDMPIIKFNLSKPVRVCNTCFEVLTLGGGM
ncbi:hypothetical protein SNE40_002431 [Patella caerulea]|uniref:Rabankyrin-5 n=1 Tax=Patella caerulea TaxID=87958 RepID=A0AAN8K7R0_PATCE